MLSAPPAHGFGDNALGRGLQLTRAVGAAIVEGYRVAPALMLGLALAIGLPLLAAASRIVRGTGHPSDAVQLSKIGSGGEDNAELADDSVTPVSPPFLELESGGKSLRYTILRDMLRIGREEDNDIRIPRRGVHRYHAAIHREDYDDWHITDLSGLESHGLIVNGRRCREARLNDGDLIQLGPGKLRFRAGCA
jgi:hypothetical protein